MLRCTSLPINFSCKADDCSFDDSFCSDSPAKWIERCGAFNTLNTTYLGRFIIKHDVEGGTASFQTAILRVNGGSGTTFSTSLESSSSRTSAQPQSSTPTSSVVSSTIAYSGPTSRSSNWPLSHQESNNERRSQQFSLAPVPPLPDRLNTHSPQLRCAVRAENNLRRPPFVGALPGPYRRDGSKKSGLEEK